jgi:hypothetical protein
MGEVYRARDNRLGRDVAIKVMHQDRLDQPELSARFERESRAVAQLNHANIVHLFDVGEHEGLPYIVMELLEGENLRSILKQGHLSLKKALDLGRQVAKGLSAAHDAGIIHRDLKPENIFLTREGVYKILDFGLAKEQSTLKVEEPNTTPMRVGSGDQLTQEGMTLGTLDYLSPEQLAGTAVDVRTDLFAFGVLLWEALVGRPPFNGKTTVDTLHAILREDVPAIPEELGVPSALERIIGRCLEKDPAARFRSAHDLDLALEVMGGSFSSGPVTGMPKAVLPGIPSPKAMGVAVAATLAGLMAMAAWYLRPDLRKGLDFVQITPRRCVVTGAAFLPGSQGLLYSASLSDSQQEEVFRVGKPGELPRSLGIKGAGLLGVNEKGEVLLLLRGKPGAPSGTLAVLSPNAMAPRELAHGVAWADWGPDGTPIIQHYRYQGRRIQAFEYPKGRILYEVPFGLNVHSFTVSPGRDQIAFLEKRSTSLYLVKIHLASGEVQRKLLGTNLSASSSRLGWGREGLLFVRWEPEKQSSRLLRINDRMELSRDLIGLPSTYELRAGKEGAWLLTDSDSAVQPQWLRPKTTASIPAQWSDGIQDRLSLSADGTLLAGMDDRGIFVLRAGDPSPILVGEGSFLALSADGRWVIAELDKGGKGTVLRLMPVGEGESPILPGEWIPNRVEFLPGNRTLFVSGKRTDVEAQGTFLVDVDSGSIRSISETQLMGPLSPDGTHAIQFVHQDLSFRLFDLNTGKADPRPIAHYGQETIAGWCADGKGIWVVPHEQRDPAKVSISRLDLASWSLRHSHVLPLLSTFQPQGIFLSQDGKAGLAVQSRPASGFLFLAKGLE